jgi:chemotaxis protein MotB
VRYREIFDQKIRTDQLNESDLDQSLQMRFQSSGEEWVLSYADVVTLLLCFFIMFVHFKEVEKVKSASKIQNSSIPEKKSPPQAEVTEKKTEVHADEGDEFPTFSPQMKAVLSSLNMRLSNLNIGDHELGKTGLVIYLNEGVFDVGKFEARAQSLDKLSNLADMLRPDIEKLQIEIQGYADPTPVRVGPKSTYKSNLELSVLRSLSVLRKFVELGLPESSMAVTGFGEYRQITSLTSQDEDLLAKNRRVSIRIIPKE